ncbi:DUF4952 domain-containing protein [Undibacterium sp.]|uniref:DUF4952 domain-containing protein n=1 Tax=Undibacterium sp. TaxID=1914977 RepID=UPI00272F479B|nr:DUF4952 domain-containing protein [Undibacterium sp.]MDP1979512.1 DUF4952 domain-containing protein [Undibacterium sp.]
MYKRFLLSILTVLFASEVWASDVAPRVNSSTPQCADFLQKLGKKPAALIFLGCKPAMDAQIHTLLASYKTKGSEAAQIERYLILHTRMQPLHRVCCIWENRNSPAHGKGSGQLVSQTEFNYRISMGTTENLISQRKDWAKIDWFYVSVELALESP